MKESRGQHPKHSLLAQMRHTAAFTPSAQVLGAAEQAQTFAEAGTAIKPVVPQHVQPPMEGVATVLNALNDSSFTTMTFEPVITAENHNIPTTFQAFELKQAAFLVAMAVAPLTLMLGMIGINSFVNEAQVTRRAANWASTANHIEVRANPAQRLMSQRGG